MRNPSTSPGPGVHQLSPLEESQSMRLRYPLLLSWRSSSLLQSDSRADVLRSDCEDRQWLYRLCLPSSLTLTLVLLLGIIGLSASGWTSGFGINDEAAQWLLRQSYSRTLGRAQKAQTQRIEPNTERGLDTRSDWSYIDDNGDPHTNNQRPLSWSAIDLGLVEDLAGTDRSASSKAPVVYHLQKSTL
jgi:hypothetical protein